ncbi:MAG: hypothetical protein J6X33_03280 [Clostridiales bacterium]|nr:hypothetical protein [Clostridiales bacterium]
MRKNRIITVIVTAALALAAFAGCSAKNPDQTEKTAPAAQAYKFAWKGTDITPGADCKAAVEALGSDYEVFSGADCAYEGINTVYDYKDVTIYSYTDKGSDKELINIIEVKGADLKTPEGVGNGDTPDKIKEVFGEPEVENKGGLLYKSATVELSFFVKDGTVSSMTYSMIK